MNIKKNIALSDSGFVFDPASGDSFSANPIGLEIITLLKDGKSEVEIKRHIVDHYMTDEATFEKDYYDFISTLLKLNVAEKSKK